MATLGLSHIAGAQALFDPTGIKWVQLSLNPLGANPQLVVDGSYGPATKTTVTKFQKEHNLVADGWASDATQNALRLVLAARVVIGGERGKFLYRPLCRKRSASW